MLVNELLIFLLHQDDEIVESLDDAGKPRAVHKIHGYRDFFLAHLVQEYILKIHLRLSHPSPPRKQLPP